MRVLGIIVPSMVLGAALLLLTTDADAQIRRKPVVVAQTAPQPVEKVGDGKLREKLFLAIAKNRAVAAAVKDGVNGKKFTREQAEAAWDRLVADVGYEGLLTLAKEASPKLAKEVGEGGPLARLLQWIKDHPDEVAAFIKLILSLFSLFADGEVVILVGEDGIGVFWPGGAHFIAF